MYMQLLCQLIDCVVYGMLCIVRVLYCTLNSLQLSYLHCVLCVLYVLCTSFIAYTLSVRVYIYRPYFLQQQY